MARKSTPKKVGYKPKQLAVPAGPPKQAAVPDGTPKCGLCGKTKKLTKTLCCGNWICDDESNYVIFSFARNSCHRNHDRYTLCSFHYHEGHAAGDWRTCKDCREAFDTEDYVDMGTNEYNFVKLEKPPKFAPTKCAKCKAVIKRAEGGYSMQGGKFFCMNCSGLPRELYS